MLRKAKNKMLTLLVKKDYRGALEVAHSVQSRYRGLAYKYLYELGLEWDEKGIYFGGKRVG